MTDRTLDLHRSPTGGEGAAARTRHRRHIGPAGTASRIVVGGVLVGSVVWGHARSGPDLWAWLIGLAVMPTLTIIWQRWRAGRHPERLVWLSRPIGHPATFAAFMALYLTPWYAPPVSARSDAALIFYRHDDARRGGSRVRRMRGAVHLQLGPRSRRPSRLPAVRTDRPARTPNLNRAPVIVGVAITTGRAGHASANGAWGT
jgi:hypothetical protein